MVGGHREEGQEAFYKSATGPGEEWSASAKGSHFWRRCGREWKRGELVEVQHEDQSRMMTNRAWRVQNSGGQD